MVRTPGFHCRGMGSIPGLELRSCKPCIQIKKSDGHCHRSKLDFILKNTSEKKKKNEHCVPYSNICLYCLCSVVSDSLQPYGLQPTRLLCLWDSSGKNTGMACHFLLQGFFPIQGSNPHLLHLLHRIVSCIGEGFTIWATMMDDTRSEKCQV